MAAKVNQKEVIHAMNVISTAYSYINITWMSINNLATSFHVSQNTISKWLLEAVQKGYVADLKTCTAIKNKHINEYEKNLNIHNSCLRTAYDEAIQRRSTPNSVLMANI